MRFHRGKLPHLTHTIQLTPLVNHLHFLYFHRKRKCLQKFDKKARKKSDATAESGVGVLLKVRANETWASVEAGEKLLKFWLSAEIMVTIYDFRQPGNQPLVHVQNGPPKSFDLERKGQTPTTLNEAKSLNHDMNLRILTNISTQKFCEF